jgi:transcriptional regulator with XRE-family HTH domain
MDKDLLTKTIELAKTTNQSPKEICKELKKSERWYYKVMSGEIDNPGVKTIQKLHDLLNKQAA